MIYVCKVKENGEIGSIAKMDQLRVAVEELIKINKDNWIIIEDETSKKLAEFYLVEKQKNSRRYDLDDVVKQLDSMESEIYNFRRYVEDEIERVKKGGQDG